MITKTIKAYDEDYEKFIEEVDRFKNKTCQNCKELYAENGDYKCHKMESPKKHVSEDRCSMWR